MGRVEELVGLALDGAALVLVDRTTEVRISPCWPRRSSRPSKCSMEAARTTLSIEQLSPVSLWISVISG
jgi:hypothetical protein